MKYKNKLTGAIIDTKAVLSGENWEAVEGKKESEEKVKEEPKEAKKKAKK